MQRIAYIVLCLCLGVSTLWAQDLDKPALQIADNTFFDPTKKEVKEEKYEFGVEYRLEAGGDPGRDQGQGSHHSAAGGTGTDHG